MTDATATHDAGRDTRPVPGGYGTVQDTNPAPSHTTTRTRRIRDARRRNPSRVPRPTSHVPRPTPSRDGSRVTLSPVQPWVKGGITGMILVLELVGTILAAKGQMVGARSLGVHGLWTWGAPAIYDLVANGLVGLGYLRGRAGDSPFGLWLGAVAMVGLSAWMNYTHDGKAGIFYAGASVAPMVLWFAKLAHDIKQALRNADARGIGLLWGTSPRVAHRTFLVRSRVRVPGKRLTTSALIDLAEQWIGIYDGLPRNMGQRLRRRTAWVETRCLAGMTRVVLPDVNVERLNVNDPGQDVPPKPVQDTRPAAPSRKAVPPSRPAVTVPPRPVPEPSDGTRDTGHGTPRPVPPSRPAVPVPPSRPAVPSDHAVTDGDPVRDSLGSFRYVDAILAVTARYKDWRITLLEDPPTPSVRDVGRAIAAPGKGPSNSTGERVRKEMIRIAQDDEMCAALATAAQSSDTRQES